jgi:Subtilase family
MKKRTLTTGVTPNEVLFAGSPITVQSSEPLDAKSAQGGIVVQGVRGRVQVARGGKSATWSSEETLAPGQHTLLVRGLLTTRARGIADDLRIPFFVTDSRAKVPASVRVENITRLRMKDLSTERLSAHARPAGKFIELMKGVDRKSGAPVTLAYNEAGRPIDAERLLRKVEENRARKFGKLHESLFARLETAKAKRTLPVAIWLQTDLSIDPDEKRPKGAASRPSARAVERQKRTRSTAQEFARVVEEEHGGRKARADEHAPVVYAEVSPEEIRALAKRPDVVGLFLHETEGIEDLADSMAIANSDDVHSLGFKGSGIKVAVWENAPDVTTNLSITARFKTSGFSTSDHARHTHGIVKNIEANKPHGHAPSCSLHSANSKDLDALRWAAKTKGCTVISQSFHRDSEPHSATMSYDDIYKDWLVLQWPYPTICQAAGNFWSTDPDNVDPPSDEYVNHKGYNSLAVGNHDDTAGAMSGDSVFRNPSSSHGDRELPEIAANGTDVTTVGLTKSGTSMASPAAAGCAALLQNVDATLKSWPEGCRAILLASAKRNIAGNTWWQDVIGNVDASDGTGAVDALEGVWVAKQRRWRNASATVRGWDVGTLRSRDIGGDQLTTFSYKVVIGRTFFSPRHVKVALAWDAKIQTVNIPIIGELLLGSQLTVDLDLLVFDSRGAQVGYSGSWDNSYEIAEFEGTPGETYTIKIRRWSGTDDVWFGIAWTTTGGLRLADVTRGTLLTALLER